MLGKLEALCLFVTCLNSEITSPACHEEQVVRSESFEEWITSQADGLICILNNCCILLSLYVIVIIITVIITCNIMWLSCNHNIL